MSFAPFLSPTRATAVLLLLGCATPPAHAAKQGSWTVINDPGIPREEATVTLLKDGRVLIAGGEASGEQGVITLVELFDPATDTYSTAAPLLTQRDQATATRLSNGRVLVVGGTSDNVNAAPLASAEIYDPATNSWKYTGSLHQARFAHQAVLLQDGRVLVTGGTPDVETELTSCEIWNPKTGKWSVTGSMATGRRYSSAVILPNGNVLEAGEEARSEVYSVSAGTWSSTQPEQTLLAFEPLASLKDGTILAPTSIVPQDSGKGQTYDAATNAWTSTGATEGRFYSTATTLKDGSVLIAGGCVQSCSQQSVNSVVRYLPKTHAYVNEQSMHAGRESAAAVLLTDGRVLMQGGFAGAGAAAPEIFTP